MQIGNRFKNDAPTLQKVSQQLGMSTLNLQDKLRQERTTFQTLLDQVRQEIAQEALKANDLSIMEITFLLGFSEQSGFSRAFNRWTETSPKQYRQQLAISC